MEQLDWTVRQIRASIFDLASTQVEAISNALRHAHADSVVVTVEADTDLIPDVVDDGVGMPANVARGGLLGVQRRAAKCGGIAVVAPGPAGGTRLTWRAPEQLPVTDRRACSDSWGRRAVMSCQDRIVATQGRTTTRRRGSR